MNRLLVIGATGLVLAAGVAFWQTSMRSTTPEQPFGAVSAQEVAEVDTSGIVEMTMGPADAKVTIIEYASFTCPHCASFHKGPFKKLKADYLDSDQVQFIYRDVYFDRFGLAASQVARCGGETRFFGISDMLYSQQKQWIGDGEPEEIYNNLRKIGKVAGLSEDQVNACLADEGKQKSLLAWYKKNVEADEVRSTPTLIINGEKYANMNYDGLKSVIEEKLAE